MAKPRTELTDKQAAQVEALAADKETEKLGRKKIEFDDKDWRMIEQMCALYCTGNEIAGVMGVHYDTLAARIKEVYDSNFSDYFNKHSAKGGLSLRRKQRDVAMDGNVQMLIHLGKNYLGQTDKQQVDNKSSDGSMTPTINNFNGDAQAASQAYQDIMGGK